MGVEPRLGQNVELISLRACHAEFCLFRRNDSASRENSLRSSDPLIDGKDFSCSFFLQTKLRLIRTTFSVHNENVQSSGDLLIDSISIKTTIIKIPESIDCIKKR